MMISLQVAKDTAGPAVVLSFAIAGDLGFWNPLALYFHVRATSYFL